MNRMQSLSVQQWLSYSGFGPTHNFGTFRTRHYQHWSIIRLHRIEAVNKKTPRIDIRMATATILTTLIIRRIPNLLASFRVQLQDRSYTLSSQKRTLDVLPILHGMHVS